MNTVMAMALLGVMLSLPSSGFSQSFGKLHVPPRGSTERKAILDSLRRDYTQPHKGQLVFKVKYLKAHQSWAWIYAEPQLNDAGDVFGETNGFLLHKASDGWRVMKVPPVVDDPLDPEGLDYPHIEDVKRIRRKYPSVPTDIFPVNDVPGRL